MRYALMGRESKVPRSWKIMWFMVKRENPMKTDKLNIFTTEIGTEITINRNMRKCVFVCVHFYFE